MCVTRPDTIVVNAARRDRVRFDRHLGGGAPQATDGEMELPGLGVEINEAAAAEHP